MTQLFKYLYMLFWASLAMICGLFLFVNGFFIHKNITKVKSNCSLSASEIFNFDNPFSSAVECFKPRARVILLIVDALKYDFVKKFDDKDAASTYYKNKIPIISKTLEDYPKNSRLFKFVADPPTTTMQRLTALTTGTMPTFIDIKENFETNYIEEDNYINHNIKQGTVFMGDDTWTKLYYNKFLRNYTYYSLNVADLDSVDIQVRKKIFDEMNNKDWSLLIAHTLGVDHCGHTYGMNHPEMLRMLNETNSLIENLIKSINKEEQDTVLFVIGDHGMTESGDHGGESSDETDAALFIYSTQPLLVNNMNLTIKKKSFVKQTNIVPTISIILGLPIPFSNIGSLIIEALPTKNIGESLKSLDFNFLLHSLWRNIFQIQLYIDTYFAENFSYNKYKLEEIKQMYNELLEKIQFVKSDQDLKEFINKSEEYFAIVGEVCYEIWVQFDTDLMSRGMLLMFCAIFSLFIIISGFTVKRMHTVLASSFFICVFILVLISFLISLLLYSLQIVTNLDNSLLFLCGLPVIICFAILSIQNWDCISNSWFEQSKQRKSISSLFPRLIFAVSIFGVFSNSYIVEEYKILSFFLSTVFCFLLFRNTSIFERSDKIGKSVGYFKKIYTYVSIVLAVISCLLIRCTNFFWRYRSEHLEAMKPVELNNTYFTMGKTGSIVSKELELTFVITSITSLAIYISVTRVWLDRCGNLSGYSPSELLTRFFTVIIAVATSCYWLLKLQQNAKFVAHLKHLNFLPILVYFLISNAICIIFYWPLSVFLLPKESESINISKEEASIPKLYQKIKNILYTKKNKDKNDIPIVFGLGTVYSACFILLSIFLSLLYILLVGFVIAPSVIIMSVVCFIFLYLSTMDRVCNASSLEKIVQVPDLSILCWFLIAEYFFYGTGHQATFPSIHWEAGFIGIDGSLSLNKIRAILLIINTFGSHIILGMLLPLLVIAPFTLRFVFPNLTKSSKIQWEDMKRGELLLFQNSTLFHSEVFSVSGKYILLHAFKVFICMLVSTIHRRHLMVWAIFAPKLIFQGISFIITVGSVLTSILLLIRIENSMENFISQIT